MKKDPLELELHIKTEIIAKIKTYFLEEMDEEIGDLKAELVLDFIKENMGKLYYNMGVSDLKKYLFQKMDDLSVDMDQLLL